MLLIVRLLIYGLLACIILIPIARWFWKKFDRHDKVTREAIEEHRINKEEEALWLERAEEREAIRKEQQKWVRTAETEAPSDSDKSLALGVLDAGKQSSSPVDPTDQTGQIDQTGQTGQTLDLDF